MSALRLPENLLLPCDVEQKNPADLVQVELLKQKISQLHTQYSNEQYMKAALLAEIKEAEDLVAQQEKLMSDFVTSGVASASSSIADNLQFLQRSKDRQLQVKLVQLSAGIVATIALYSAYCYRKLCRQIYKLTQN